MIDETPAGAMMAVSLGEEAVRGRLTGTLALAVITAPASCVVSGAPDEIAALASALAAEGIDTRRIEAEIAPHGPLMDGAAAALAARMARTPLQTPRVPIVSNISGTWMTGAEATDPAYWARHLRTTVQLSAGIDTVLRAHEDGCLIEIGPGRSLASPVASHPARTEKHLVLSSVRQQAEQVDDHAFLLFALAQAWTAGVTVSGRGLYDGEARRRVELPTYPFERKRYLIEPGTAAHAAPSGDAADWLSSPVWERTPPLAAAAIAPGRWLVLSDAGSTSDAVLELLEDAGVDVSVAVAADGFDGFDGRSFAMRPGTREDFERLLTAMPALPDVVLNLWPASHGIDPLDASCYSTLFLAQALAERDAHACRIAIVTTGASRVIGSEIIEPLQATALGPARVIPQELDGFICTHVDVDPAAEPCRLAARLIAEIQHGQDTSVAYRHDLRWVRRFVPIDAASTSGPPRLRDRATYLITGGLSGVGLELASAIAEAAAGVHLVLVSRAPDQAKQSAAIDRLTKTGARVTVIAADIADPLALSRAFDEADAIAGPITGVVHAAGIAGGGSIPLRTREAIEAELAAKVRGTINLHAAIAGRAVDFLVLCSSTSAFTGGFGAMAYTAANAFLDAFAESCASAGGPPVIAVNWYRWQSVGMAIEVERLHRELTGDTLVDGIAAPQGREAFLRILARADIARVAVCPIDLDRLERETRRFQSDRLDAPRPAAFHDRPDIGTSFVPAATVTEQAIAAVWRDVLGIEAIGIHDPFTALGGDSLLAVRIASRLRAALAIALPVRAFYELPTIAGLARHVDALRWIRDSQPVEGSAGIGYETGVL